MSEEKMKQLNVRIALKLYDAITAEAEQGGVSLSELVRDRLAKPGEETGGKKDSTSLALVYQQLANQLEVKDRQIERLTQLLDQEQQLKLTNNNQTELLATQMELLHDMKTGERIKEENNQLKKELIAVQQTNQQKKAWHFWK